MVMFEHIPAEMRVRPSLLIVMLFTIFSISPSETSAGFTNKSEAHSANSFFFRLRKKTDEADFVLGAGAPAAPIGNYSFEYQHSFKVVLPAPVPPPAPAPWVLKAAHVKPKIMVWQPFLKFDRHVSILGRGPLPEAESNWKVVHDMEKITGTPVVKVSTNAIAQADNTTEAFSRTRVLDPWELKPEWEGSSSLLGGYDLTGAISGDGQVGSNFYISRHDQLDRQLLFSINITSRTASVEAMDGLSFFLNNDLEVNSNPVSKNDLIDLLSAFHTNDGWSMSDLNPLRLNFRFDIDSSWSSATVYTESYSIASVPEPSSCILYFSGITLMLFGKFGRRNLFLRNSCG